MTTAHKQPNILLIILDTMRRDSLSIYGNQRETSPHFDEFANEGTLFNRAIATAQWTVPSHASMFTGLYPSTHQLTEANQVLSGSYATLAEILALDGYDTVGFCNNPLVGILNNGLQRGFNNFYNYAGAAPNRPFQTKRNGVTRALSTHWRKFARQVSNQFAHNYALFRISLHPKLTPIWTRSINYKGNTATSISDMIDYLSAHKANQSDQPVFGFLNLMGTHMPLRPPQDVLDRVAPYLKNESEAYRFMGKFNADAARWASPLDEPLKDWEKQVIEDFYDAEVAYQDAELGRLLGYLKSAGWLDDTMVIIAADHGEGHGDHDFFGHSFVVYQELVHVPLAIHYPEAFPTNMRVDTNVSTRRLFHTILQTAGLTPPVAEGDPNGNVDGLSLARAIDTQQNTLEKLVFAEAFPPNTFLNVMRHRNPHLIDNLRLTTVRRGVYEDVHKLAVVGSQVEGLFNIANDPAELKDVSNQHHELVDNLQQRISDFVQIAVSQRAGESLTHQVSDEVMDNLRALGYIE